MRPSQRACLPSRRARLPPQRAGFPSRTGCFPPRCNDLEKVLLWPAECTDFPRGNHMVPKILLLALVLLANILPVYGESYSLPFRFEVNQGQAPADVKFVAHTAGFTADLNEQRETLNLPQPVMLTFAGAGKRVRIEAENEMPIVSNVYGT